MIVELHMLQNFAPSCLNRDDTNTPKDCEFGGFRRARISSQCIKRAIRSHFREAKLLAPEELAHRTKRLVESELQSRLKSPNRTAEQINLAARRVLAGGGLQLDDANLTQYLLFLGSAEIDSLAKLINAHWDALSAAIVAPETSAGAGEKKKRAKQQKSEAKDAVPDEVRKGLVKLLDGGKAADLALFGRMLADLPGRNVDAACQVAHALSTNKAAIEMDYFTAVDDLKPKESDAGAGMIGSVEFNSSCFYRYANIDTDQLLKNLGGDQELAAKTVDAFLKASVEAIPTGKQNTFAAHNPPDFVMAIVRPHGQTNLANAFVQPVRPTQDRSLVDGSIAALDGYWKQLRKVSPMPDGSTVALVRTTDGNLANLYEYEVDSIKKVFDKVTEKIAR